MGFQDIKDSITWASTHGGENAALAYLTQYFPRATDSGPGHGGQAARRGHGADAGSGLVVAGGSNQGPSVSLDRQIVQKLTQ